MTTTPSTITTTLPDNITLLRNGELVYRQHPRPVEGYPSKAACPYCGSPQIVQHNRCYACEGQFAEGGPQ